MDLLGASRTSDEKENLEDLPTARHRENLGHPCSDPLKMLWGLNDPDESKTTGGNSTIGIASDDVTDVGDLVRDTNTSSPQHDSAIRAEIFAACDMTLAWVRVVRI